jgi:hypothetical protein
MRTAAKLLILIGCPPGIHMYCFCGTYIRLVHGTQPHTPRLGGPLRTKRYARERVAFRGTRSGDSCLSSVMLDLGLKSYPPPRAAKKARQGSGGPCKTTVIRSIADENAALRAPGLSCTSSE